MKNDSMMRPRIWVKPEDRGPLLAKIAAQPWARSVFTELKTRVKDDVAAHRANPEAFLRGLPLVSGSQPHPTFAYFGAKPSASARSKMMHFLQLGIDCGALYFLTQEAPYAACTADILSVFVEALIQLKPSEAVGNGGYLYPSDHLLEARIIGAQIPLLYDFAYPFLRAEGKVLDLGTRQRRGFAFDKAQEIFRRYADLAIQHGLIDCNWPVLELPSLAHNALALDDPAQRNQRFAFVTHQNTRHQDSLQKVMERFARPGDIWPESFQYANSVASLATYGIALVERQGGMDLLTDNFVNVPLALARTQEMRFPNGEYVRFGDGPRESEHPFASFEIAYQLGIRRSDLRLTKTFGGLLNEAIAQKAYNRAAALGRSGGPNPYLSPLHLLWFAPTVTGQYETPPPKRADTLPFVGLVLQRNLSPSRDPRDALMAVVSGGSHVHGHASGMALELYGKGQVLGANAGKGAYTTDEHENYRRLFAAYNTVIVNGASQSAGGWANLETGTVQKIAMEPEPGKKPISDSCSFSLTRCADNTSPGAKAVQERLVILVRTSATTGYYVDVFRSRALPDTPEQFHDYVYHNIGDAVELSSPSPGLRLADAPGRFRPIPGAHWKQNQSYLWPGWHFFQKVQASPLFAGKVEAAFSAGRMPGKSIGMRVFVPGGEGREYARALAPATHDAPAPYEDALTPVLVIRQQGSAWERPFAVVYEPVEGNEGKASIVSVISLLDTKGLAGLTVVSKIGERTLTQHVLVRSCIIPALDLAMEGEAAIVTKEAETSATTLYLGAGTLLRYGKSRLVAPGTLFS